MKIAIIMPLAEQRGGAEKSLLYLLQEQIAECQWLVIFLQDGPMADQAQRLGVTTYVVHAGRLRQFRRYLSAIKQIVTILQEECPDAVLNWMGYAQLYGGVAAPLANIPAVWYQHGIPVDKNWMDRVATWLPARGILTSSRAMASVQELLRPVRPMRVVSSAVELKQFNPDQLPSPRAARQRIGFGAAEPLIGIVGRLQRWKGMHVLVEAMPEILEQYPNAACVVVGGEHTLEPDYSHYLRGLIKHLGLEESVTLAGYQQNVPEWMQAMDIIVHASDREPFGLVVVEAMALGKPVVAGDAAGPTEIITDGVHGLLTPYGDAKALAGAVLRYLNDPAFAARIGEVAREHAQSFSTQRYAENIASALRDLLAGTSRSARKSAVSIGP